MVQQEEPWFLGESLLTNLVVVVVTDWLLLTWAAGSFLGVTIFFAWVVGFAPDLISNCGYAKTLNAIYINHRSHSSQLTSPLSM